MIPQNIQKRLLKFLLKRTIGQFIEHELDLDQLDVQLGNGWLRLSDLSLDTLAVNSIIPHDIPLRIYYGHVETVSITIPWMNIWSSNCKLEIADLTIHCHIVQSEQESSAAMELSKSNILQESVFMNDSVHVANDFMKEDLVETAEDVGSEGISMLASLIDHITSRLWVLIKNTRIRIYNKNDFLEISIPDIVFKDISHELVDRNLLPIEAMKSVVVSSLSITQNSLSEIFKIRNEIGMKLKIKRSDTNYRHPQIMTTVSCDDIEMTLNQTTQKMISDLITDYFESKRKLVAENQIEHEVEGRDSSELEDTSQYFDAESSLPFNSFQQVNSDFSPSPRRSFKEVPLNVTSGEMSGVLKLKVKMISLFLNDEISDIGTFRIDMLETNALLKKNEMNVYCQKLIVYEQIKTQIKSTGFMVPVGQFYPILQFSGQFSNNSNIPPFKIIDEYFKGINTSILVPSLTSPSSPVSCDLHINVKTSASDGLLITVKTRPLHISVDINILNRIKKMFKHKNAANNGSGGRFKVSFHLQAVRLAIFLNDPLPEARMNPFALYEKWPVIVLNNISGWFADDQIELSVESGQIFLQSFQSDVLKLVTSIEHNLKQNSPFTTAIIKFNRDISNKAVSITALSAVDSDSNIESKLDTFRVSSALFIRISIPLVTCILDKQLSEDIQSILSIFSLQRFLVKPSLEPVIQPTQQMFHIQCEHFLIRCRVSNECTFSLDLLNTQIFSIQSLFGQLGYQSHLFIVNEPFLTQQTPLNNRTLINPLTLPGVDQEIQRLILSISDEPEKVEIELKVRNLIWNYGKLGVDWSIDDFQWITELQNFFEANLSIETSSEFVPERFYDFRSEFDRLSVHLACPIDHQKHGFVLVLTGSLCFSDIEDLIIHFSSAHMSLLSLNELESRPLVESELEDYVVGYYRMLGYHHISSTQNLIVTINIKSFETKFTVDDLLFNFHKDSFVVFLFRLQKILSKSAPNLGPEIVEEPRELAVNILDEIEEDMFKPKNKIEIVDLNASSKADMHDLEIVEDFYSLGFETSPAGDHWGEIETEKLLFSDDQQIAIHSFVEGDLQFQLDFFDSPSAKNFQDQEALRLNLWLIIKRTNFNLHKGFAFADSKLKQMPLKQEEEESDLFSAAVEIIHSDFGGFDMREEDVDTETIRHEIESLMLPVHSIIPDDSISVVNERIFSREDTLKSPTKHLIAINVDEFSLKSFERSQEGSGLVSMISASIRDIEIVDSIPTSVWNKFLTCSNRVDRETGSKMVEFSQKGIQLVPSKDSMEFRLKFECLPLRLHVDQDALEFLVDFFSFQINEGSQEDDKKSTYFQHVDISRIDLCIDYKPKRIDYEKLKQGGLAEWANLFHLEAANMSLIPLRLAGISGWQKLFIVIQLRYFQDISASQLPNLISGITPIRTLVNMGTGLKELVMIPVEQFKKDGRLLRGIRQGTEKFVETTAVEGVKVSAKLVVGAQGLLEKADSHLSGTIMPQNPQSKFSNQPRDISEGFSQAYDSIRKSFNETRAILAVPVNDDDKSSSVGKVARVAPVAVIHPLVGLSEALKKTLLGIQNSLDPESRESTSLNVVRMKKGGKRFEIACYKNKVVEYRNGIETDLDNVLQTAAVFTNVSKGQIASSEDIEKAFKTKDVQTVILEILRKGELQVSTLERNNQLQNIQKDIIHIITEKTVHPETKRPYPATMIEKAVAQLQYNLSANKSAKQQALDIIRLLQSENIIPIQRAQMKVQIVIPSKESKRLKEKLTQSISRVEDEDYGNTEYQMTCLIDPGQFRVITDLLQAETKGRARLEVLSLSETVDGDERFQ